MTFDRWLTTNPADEYLGPLPDEDYGPLVEVVSGGPDRINCFLDERLVAVAIRHRDLWLLHSLDDDEERVWGFANSKVEASARLTDLAEEIAEGRL